MNRKLRAIDEYLAKSNPPHRVQLYGAISVLVARHVRNPRCFAGDQNYLNVDSRFHEDYARRNPSHVSAVLAWKVEAAMGCLQGEPLALFYGEVSAAIGQAASAYK